MKKKERQYKNEVIDWDKYSLIINSKRVFLVGGEFHYWRVPDRESWLDILKMYKSAGLNCIRIYFHWGFHQPNEDKFIFEGNRDVNYLLELCEQLGLFVFIACGPYICAETNSGGYPLWLVRKRNIRIRHMKRTLLQKYDLEFVECCKKWYAEFIKHIKHHQITESEKGCIIGFQIDNEYPEKIFILKGNRKYMQTLYDTAKEEGISVPIFHNDIFEFNSWNGLVDLYGFDKYPIHAQRHPKNLPLPAWNTKSFAKRMGNSEKKIQKFGPPANESPLFIPELQGGWFNHWTISYGFDELYDFFGPNYQKVIYQTCAAQRVTIMSLYMFYGGTNWGIIGSPEVYSSYDYSGAIREYKYISERYRQLRLFTLFTKSFESELTKTLPVDVPNISCTVNDILYKQRYTDNGVRFYFFRNFNKDHIEEFAINMEDGTQTPKVNKIQLKYLDGFIAIGNLKINGFKIKLCSLPIVIKHDYLDGTLLVCIQNKGELLLEGTDFQTKGYINSLKEKNFTRFSFVREGYDTIVSPEGKTLYIVCLEPTTALTLNADFDNAIFTVIYGPYHSYFDKKGSIEIETMGQQEVRIISSHETIQGFKNLTDARIPGVKFAVFGKTEDKSKIIIGNWSKLTSKIDDPTFSDYWTRIDYEQRNPLDHGYFGAYTWYKCVFNPGEVEDLSITINIRNKAGIWLNNQCIGGMVNYSPSDVNLFKPGSMNGPDPSFLGKKKFNLTPYLKKGVINELIILTESLGQPKGFFPMMDTRNPRGLLSAKFSKKVLNVQWYISGVDVTKIENPYNSIGLIEENLDYTNGKAKGWISVTDSCLKITPNDKLLWYKTSFKYEKGSNIRSPLRIHLEGLVNANIFLNGHYIGRYWGEKGPQHDFYLMDNLVKSDNTLVIAVWTIENDNNFSVKILPYNIDIKSGNINEQGHPFETEKHFITL